jgi:toxin CcdB
MARLDVHPMPGAGGRAYVIDVQADLLSQINTRAVVPLLPLREAPPQVRALNPVFDIGGEPYLMVTQAIAAVPVRALQRPVASLAERCDEVTRALDMLLVGF